MEFARHAGVSLPIRVTNRHNSPRVPMTSWHGSAANAGMTGPEPQRGT
jgi:hypothetical protein